MTEPCRDGIAAMRRLIDRREYHKSALRQMAAINGA
jgi:hypothetical protein